MLTLYFTPGACSLAAHIVLEESGEAYTPREVDFAHNEQRSEAYLKINPQGRVPVLGLDNGQPLAENTAILPYLGKRFGLWPSDPLTEARALSLIGFFAASVHPRTPTSAGRSGTRPMPQCFRRSKRAVWRPFTATSSKSTTCWPARTGFSTDTP